MVSKLWRTAATALAVLTATATQASEADRPDALVLSGRIIDGSGAAPICASCRNCSAMPA